MAVEGILFVKAERHVQGIVAILTTTACEWFLIFLLLIDAVFSFLLTKFARYCDLHIPCIFCSRLDHVLGNEKPEFYWNLLCSNHKSEISSLISCHIHGKLADGRGMCNDCISSFSTKSKSNSDMHRLVVGKLGFDFVGCDSPSRRWCSCCNKPSKSKPKLQRQFQLKSPASRVTKSNIPSLHNHRDGLKKLRYKLSGSAVTTSHIGKQGSDLISYLDYSELKINSDSESEFPFSDDDYGSNIVRDITAEKDDIRKPQGAKCLTPDVSSWPGFLELNWQQPNQKNHLPLPEFISLDDISRPNTMDLLGGVSPISQSVNPSAPAEPISLVDMDPPFDYLKAPVGASSDKPNVTATMDTKNATINHHEEILKLLNTTGAGEQKDQVLNAPASVDQTYNDPCDVIKFSVSGWGREASAVAEQPTDKELDRVSEDLNFLLTQNSSAQGIHGSISNRSSNVQGTGDVSQVTNDFSSNSIHNLQKSLPVEKTEPVGLDSLDGSTVSEIEGESTIDRLKRQVEYDRKCMNALFKELDEERSAAAVAANEAMAMITRLQEEKAALHMDALQYLRMMEEQAEYDMEALEKANDLQAEKEKEVQDLEAELEFYRLKYLDESVMGTIPDEGYDSKKENVNVENGSSGHIKDDYSVPSNSMYSESAKGIDKPDVEISSLSEFEDEILYISKHLKSLEKKLQTFAHNGTVNDMSNVGYIEEAADRVHNQEQFPDMEGSSISCHVEENGLSFEKDLPVSHGSLPAQGLNASIDEDHVVSEENNLLASGQTVSNCRKIDLVALENEISDLNDRLEALEDNYNFLEHTFNLLQTGNEGLPFFQQIVHQLQEIQTIGRSRCRAFP